ncbi:MAG: type II secretion system GspH family protein [Pseudomonadota bacterium]|nr:type II secretion system GspH family protein [Pseudomonadota bacterium]
MNGAQQGFTLVELILVMVLTAVIGAALATFLARPMTAYVDLSRRAALVDEADTALRRMARDIRRALPNSLRVRNDGLAVEFLYTADGARYRAAPGRTAHTDANDWLDFTAADAAFNVFSAVELALPAAAPGGPRLAVYTVNPEELYQDLAGNRNPGVVTPADTAIGQTLDEGDEMQIRLTPAFRFRLRSPQQRLYVVSTPVTYRCDPARRVLEYFDNYAPAAAFTAQSGAGSLLSTRVAACAFSYNPGTARRAGVITLVLTLAEQAEGGATESVRLLHQVQVDNTP